MRASLSNTIGFAPPRPDGEPVAAEHPVHLVAAQPGGVHHPPASQATARRGNLVITVTVGGHPGDPGREHQPDAPAPTASVAKASGVVQGQMILVGDSSARAPLAPAAAHARRVPRPPAAARPGTGSAAPSPRSRAGPPPVRVSRRRAARRCAPPGSRLPRRTPAAGRCPGSGPAGLSRLPGLASNPVCRIAVFALDVPVPTSGAASRSTRSSAYRASVRAIAVPTTPRPDDHHVGPGLRHRGASVRSRADRKIETRSAA